MNSNLNKRKNRNQMMNSNVSNHSGGHNMINFRSKPSRGKTSPQEKNASQAEGVYYNGRLMHAATSLVGSIVQVVVKGGNTYEGVMKTFSPEFEIVVDMVVEIDPKACNGGQNIGGLLDSLKNKRDVQNTMIFKLQDVIMLNLLNVDLDYASRGHFTDTEISRFDAQTVGKSKDLVPWEGPPEKDGLSLEEDAKNAQNGWDANDMFRLNEEKYQVSSTYDSSLQGYTVPLEMKDTEEFKQKQAEAEKIAHDIENDAVYKERIAKEDGDEEDKYSAVARPPNDTHSGSHMMRPAGRRKSQNNSSNSIGGGGGGRGKTLQSSGPLLPSPTYQKGPQSYHHHSQQHAANYSNKPPSNNSPPVMQQKTAPKEETSAKSSNIAGGSHGYSRNDADDYSNQPLSQGSVQPVPLPQRAHNDNRRSNIAKKREDVSADFKKFSTDFKLASEVKEVSLKDSSPKDVSTKPDPSDKSDVPKDKDTKVASNAEVEKHLTTPQEVEPESDADKVVKKSTLNPNAKEFNPAAKSFTPRTPVFTVQQIPSTVSSGMMITNPHQQQQVHQAHQSRLQAPMVQFQPQFVAPVQFTVAPNQYMIQNMAVAPAFQANNNTQNIRYRSKGPQQYQNQNNRHDYSQPSAQVAAATGHPVLATAPIAQQIAVPYNPAQQAPNNGPPQVYSTALYPMHTRMNMGAVGVVPHVSYGDPNLQPYFMTNVGHVQLQSHLVAQAVAAQQNASGGGQHSAPTTPQSGPPSTPLHGAPPTPSPVHHQGSGVPNQPPTPTPGLMYGGIPHGGQTAVSVSSHSSNCTPHYVNPQMVPLILPTGQALQHSQHPATGHGGHVHPSLSHANAAANHHNSSQTPLLSAVPVTIPVIPTSATIVATPGAIQTHFAPNSQNRIQ